MFVAGTGSFSMVARGGRATYRMFLMVSIFVVSMSQLEK